MRHFKQNMLVQFSVISAVVLAAIAIVLIIFLSGKIESNAIAEVINHIETDTTVILTKALNPADLKAPLVGERFDQLDDVVQRFLLSDLIALVKVWGADGSLIYSSDPLDVESPLALQPELSTALSGTTSTDIHHADPSGSTIRQHDFLEVYAPIRFPGDSSVHGAVEIYQYYAPTLQHIVIMRSWVSMAIITGFLFLYGTLVSIVWRGSSTIKRQQATITSANKELQAANTALEASRLELERRVEERTLELSKANETLVVNEKALKENEERYRNTLDSMLEGCQIIDYDWRYLYINYAAIRHGRLTKEKLLGHTMMEMYPGIDKTEMFAELRRCMEKRVPYHMENPFTFPDGYQGWFELSIQPVPEGIFVLSIDITERKKAEERQKQLQMELALSSRLAAIGELAAGVAHEINNPLTGIIGFSELLLRKSTDEKAREDLEIIHSEGLRAAKIVENLLTFARQRELEKKYADVNDILKKALDLRAYELKTSTVEVVLDLAASLPKIMVNFHQVQEVFLNIILNAEQAMTEANRKGKLSIKTQATKNYIRISFADDGPGISSEHLDKLFDPFFTTRGGKGGTGLGLSICHGIITEHGGRLYAKNNPGEGATFFVELPLTTEKIGKSKFVK